MPIEENTPVEKKMVQYAVWEEDGESGYWALYDTLEDAVHEHENEEVYEMKPKLLGTFSSKVVLVKSKKRKIA